MGAVRFHEAMAAVKVYPTVAGAFSFAIVLFDLATAHRAVKRPLDGAFVNRLTATS